MQAWRVIGLEDLAVRGRSFAIINNLIEKNNFITFNFRFYGRRGKNAAAASPL